MSAGATIAGLDGIIKINGTNEIPCLKSWTFSPKANIQTLDTKCMKSNNDGGSSNAGGFDKKVAGSKSATFQAVFNWQESDSAGAAPDLRTTDIGNTVSFELYPNDSSSGKRKIAGNALIADISIASEVNGLITQTVSFEVDGQWSDGVVA